MSKPGFVIVGVIMVLAGALFFLQGINVVKGSGMSGSNFWAFAGPVLAIAGLAVVRVGQRGRLR